MQHYKTTLNDEAATQALGKSLAQVLIPGLSLYLRGDLGAGKTCLTRALLHAAGHQGKVRSPTYTLAEPYQLQLAGQTVKLLHFDLYRMSSPDEFIEAGFREEFNQNTICIVEWPEKGQGILPEPDILLELSFTGVMRAVELHALSVKGQQCLANFRFLPNL